MEISSGNNISELARSRKVSSALWEPYKHAFLRLTVALQRGNLESAKLAYASLGELQNPRGITPLAKIGKYLEDNNVADAQKVMRNLLEGRGSDDVETSSQTSAPKTPVATPFRTTAYASTGALINTTA